MMKQFVIAVETSHREAAHRAENEPIAIRAMNALLGSRPRDLDEANFVFKAFTLGMTDVEAEAAITVIERLAPLMCKEAHMAVDMDMARGVTRTTFTIYYQNAPRATQALVNAMSGVPESFNPEPSQRRMRFNKH